MIGYDTIFDGFSTTTNFPRNSFASPLTPTARIYEKFAYFFYTPYRTSDGGVIKDIKTSGTQDIWIRSNASYSEGDSKSFSADDVSGLVASAPSGKASALSIRPITQATY